MYHHCHHRSLVTIDQLAQCGNAHPSNPYLKNVDNILITPDYTLHTCAGVISKYVPSVAVNLIMFFVAPFL